MGPAVTLRPAFLADLREDFSSSIPLALGILSVLLRLPCPMAALVPAWSPPTSHSVRELRSPTAQDPATSSVFLPPCYPAQSRRFWEALQPLSPFPAPYRKEFKPTEMYHL